MPQIGPLEILTVAIIALIVFGPEKLPEISRTAGRWMAELRRMATDVREEFQTGLEIGDEPDDDEPPTKVSPTDHPIARAMRGNAQAGASGGDRSDESPDGASKSDRTDASADGASAAGTPEASKPEPGRAEQ